jgi:hypothetical protein
MVNALPMDHSESNKSAIHYHIRWSNSFLDWKPFLTEEEATIVAGQIKKPNESFTVVQRDDECERCKMFRSRSKP